MRPRRKSRVYPDQLRPFKVGDRASLWMGTARIDGTIVEIFTEMYSREVYAVVKIGRRFRRTYPLWQLIPSGTTWLTFRHLLYVVVTTLNPEARRASWR